MHLETLKPLIKYDELLDGNPVSRSKCCKTLPNIQAGDFGFVYNDSTVIKSDKVYYDDCASKIIFALQEDQQPRIDRTIEQVSTDDLSTCTTVKNVDSPFLVKPELKTPELQHQQSGDLFETLQQLNTMTKPRGTTDTAKQPAFSKIDRVSLAKLQSFSCDASKSKRSADCEDDKSQRSKRKDETKDTCSQEVAKSRCRIERRQSKSYKRREDCEKSDEPRAVCKDTIKERNDCKPKCEKRRKKRDISEKERQKCTGSSRKRSNSCRRRNSSRAGDKSCNKVDGKRRYSQQSIFSVSQDRKSFSTLIPDIALGTNISKTTQRFYASCSKDEKDRKQSPSCEKRRRKCETKEKDEIKKRCVKGPAKCISRKKTIHKMRTCQSTQKDKHKKSCKSTKKSNREEFCTSRKKEFMKNEKLKTDSVKPCTSSIMKDKKPKEQSMKGQIGREYKEIDECKKGFKKEKGGNKAKMVSIEHKPSGLGRIISSYKEQKKDSEKFASTPNESITSTDTIFKWFIIQSRVINSKIPIVAKDVRLFNVMFDRSFSTAKLDYQDDFAIERTMSNGEMAQNYSANSDDFIHDDELPNYVEIEYEDEEDDVYDIRPLVDRSPESIESYAKLAKATVNNNLLCK
ncbi:histone-lysine N-methyltransferase, H3 lysine-79 specific-like [Temnothorax curvispinosus]|uniref:Histone-lysine N-methyltransferase, H3 lysine-79 specific-like n=1 Tax=Temnothorax curvispinosus TaxID=300111 RepID=A0A6J1R501_9HYME|nr:histone-lysine N-methyltransferase, H3 lysine-79 specific-like [Temnothorax curvispinosus]